MTRNIWQTLARYLTNEMSEEEKAVLLDENKNNQEQQQTLKEVTAIWQLSETRPENIDWETEGEWEILKNKAENQSEVVEFKPWYTQYYWQAAAIIVVIMAIGYIWKTSLNRTDSPENLISQKTSDSVQVFATTDSVKEFYLPDSSRIWLNRHSTLIYKEDFGMADRRVSLIGEGYFMITKDKNKPFIIQAAETETRVVGTSFDLKAYAEEKNVELTVISGKVEFSKSGTPQKKVMLIPKQKAVFQKSNSQMHSSTISNIGLSLWVKQNNSTYIHEIRSPKQFITHSFTWRKNTISQTVVEGKLTNLAAIAAYRDIELTYKIYTKKGSEKPARSFTIHKQIMPGQTIDYKYNLGNIFTNTTRVSIDIKGADTAP